MGRGSVHESDLLAGARNRGIHLDAVAARKLLRIAAGNVDLPQVSVIDVARVRSDDHELAIRGPGHVLNFETSRRQRCHCSATRRDRIQVRPTVLLGSENDSIARGPLQLVFSHRQARKRIHLACS